MDFLAVLPAAFCVWESIAILTNRLSNTDLLGKVFVNVEVPTSTAANQMICGPRSYLSMWSILGQQSKGI